MPAQDVKLETKNHDPDKKLVKYMKEKSSLEREKSALRKARRKVDSKPKRRLRTNNHEDTVVTKYENGSPRRNCFSIYGQSNILF